MVSRGHAVSTSLEGLVQCERSIKTQILAPHCFLFILSYREGVKGLSMGMLFSPQCRRGTGGSSSCSSAPTAILRPGFLVEPAFGPTTK